MLPSMRTICLFMALLPTLSLALLDGLYCGKDNCYDVLGVTRDSSKAEIGKAYRLLARKFHPDMHKGVNAKVEAEVKFKLIATAYEILKDEESRKDYDYMLDNPDEYYAHYYRYYRRRVAPKVDVRIVLISVLTVISICQYYSGWKRYDDAIKFFSNVPKYRMRALEIAKDEIDEKIHNRKGKNRLSKTDQKEELERIIRKVVEEKLDIKGGYAKPTLWDVAWVQLIISPYTIFCYILWHLKWFWHFTVQNKPYGIEERLYLIRKNMKMGEHQFNVQDERQIEEYLRLELWDREKFEEWKIEQEDEMKARMAENPRYKSYRRYMKNHGPGRLTFEE